MNPETGSAGYWVLLCSDAGFSRAVMRELARRRCMPQLVILPEYPPASVAGSKSHKLLEIEAARNFPAEFEQVEFDYAPASLQADCAVSLRGRGLGFMLVACWPYLLGDAMLAAVDKAALNLHPSLLPAWRGADPLGAQLEAGDTDFGVTLHLLDSRFDRGDIVAQSALPAPPAIPSRAELERQCAQIGVDMFVEALRQYPAWRPRPQ